MKMIKCEDGQDEFLNPRLIESLYIEEMGPSFAKPFVVSARSGRNCYHIKSFILEKEAKDHLKKVMKDFGPYGIE